MPVRDYLFRVYGDCIRAGYAYPLLAALKLNDLELSQDERVFFGPLEGVGTIGRGYLTIRERTHWRVRAPSELTDRLVNLCGRKLLIGDHVIRLGELHIEHIRQATELHAEFIAIKSMHFQKSDRHPTHREFLGWSADKLRRKYGLSAGKIEVGRRRRLHIGDHPASTGYALGVYGVDPRVSLQIQHDGLGGRRHMGGALFLPGVLPQWVKGEGKCFDILKPERKRRKEPMNPNELMHAGSGMQFVHRADLFLRAVRRGAYPNATWLMEHTNVSRPTALRFIRSLRDDLGAPLMYRTDRHGWELSDPAWHTRGL